MAIDARLFQSAHAKLSLLEDRAAIRPRLFFASGVWVLYGGGVECLCGGSAVRCAESTIQSFAVLDFVEPPKIPCLAPAPPPAFRRPPPRAFADEPPSVEGGFDGRSRAPPPNRP